jgi:uncharacterized protein
MVDQSWRDQPVGMAADTIALAAGRIAEHAREHHLRSVWVVLHGGEPLLTGTDTIARIARAFRGSSFAGIDVQLDVQTNATLLDERYLRVFAEYRVRVGVSLDGARAAHDLYRRFANGNGSHEQTMRGLRLLQAPAYRHLFAGILCTIDIDNEPLKVYDYLSGLEPPVIDFLLPHGNWSAPPPGKGTTPYADWLIPIFDRWYSGGNVEVRLFQEIVQLVLGGRSGTEAVGLTPSTVLVIETDGSLEQVDTLKSTYQGAADTGLHLADNPIDEALRHPSIAARQIGLAGLAQKCQKCTIGTVCGGGYYPHRYRAGEGFLNPSVYCADLMKLISHVRARVVADIGRRAGKSHADHS